jgi:IMP dehydrogenase
MKIKKSLTFDDVLLVPQKSFNPPEKVNTKIELTKKIKLEIPLISAAMDTVTESKMAIAVAKLGGLGIIHKNMTIDQQVAEVRKVKKKNLLCGASTSVGEKAIQRAKALAKAGVDLIVIDVAHGHYFKVAETIKILKKEIGKKVVLVGGNVATAQATLDLIKAGADVVKVGVGPGSICTTRIIAGIGVPQLTAVMDAVQAATKTKTPIIADGGIRYSGDIVKALAVGASAVMMGGLFAGTDEAPGKIVTIDGNKMKTYRGMGSIDAMKMGSKDRYLQSNKKLDSEMIAEGVVSYVDYKGTVDKIIYQLIGGLRQGLGYCGAQDIEELSQKAEFIKISKAGLQESHPHNLQSIKKAPNYRGDFL